MRQILTALRLEQAGAEAGEQRRLGVVAIHLLRINTIVYCEIVMRSLLQLTRSFRRRSRPANSSKNLRL